MNEKRSNVILGDSYRTLWGQDTLEDTLCGLTFRLSVPSFYQVNPEQTEVLYGKAAEFAALTGQETVLDLYCGIGTIGLTLAAQAREVIGAEVVPEAVEDARQTPSAMASPTPVSSAATRGRPPAVWPGRACGPTWSAWTRPGKD